MFPRWKYISRASDISSSASNQSPAKQSNHCSSYTLLNTSSPQPFRQHCESRKNWLLIYNVPLLWWPALLRPAATESPGFFFFLFFFLQTRRGDPGHCNTEMINVLLCLCPLLYILLPANSKPCWLSCTALPCVKAAWMDIWQLVGRGTYHLIQ